jgi:hypothetical protein
LTRAERVRLGFGFPIVSSCVLNSLNALEGSWVMFPQVLAREIGHTADDVARVTRFLELRELGVQRPRVLVGGLHPVGPELDPGGDGGELCPRRLDEYTAKLIALRRRFGLGRATALGHGPHRTAPGALHLLARAGVVLRRRGL